MLILSIAQQAFCTQLRGKHNILAYTDHESWLSEPWKCSEVQQGTDGEVGAG